MASFQSDPLTLLRQTLSSLFLIFVLIIISIHPSYGDYEDEPVRGEGFLSEICNHTSDNKFCMDTLFKTVETTPSANASDVAHVALQRAQGLATDIQVAIASLLEDSSNNSSQQQDRQLLQRCELDNSKAITEISSVSNDMNSNSMIYNMSMMLDLTNAANAIQNCQDIIQGSPFSALLSNKNMDLIMLCQIAAIAIFFNI